jgi:hypothetical protein
MKCYTEECFNVCRLPTAAAWDRSQVRSCGVCHGQNDTGAGFIRVLGSPAASHTPGFSIFINNPITHALNPNTGSVVKQLKKEERKFMKICEETTFVFNDDCI